MAEIPPLNVKVNIDASGVQAGVSKATAGLNQISASSKGLTSNLSSLKTTMLGVFGGNLITNAVFMLGRELNKMKQEAIDVQTQTERLNVALTNIGITSKDAQQGVFAVADSYYQLAFEASDAVGAMARLVSATGDTDQANKLLALSADFARDRHISLNDAATALARATTGNMKAFTQYGITIDKTLPKNQAIAKAFDELNAKIGGQAQAYLKTFAGQWDLMKEKFDNIAQQLGKVLLPIFSLLVKGFGTLADYISNNSTALGVFLGILVPTLLAIKAMQTTLIVARVVMQAYAFASYQAAAGSGALRIATIALWTAMKANPFIAIASAVIAVGAAFVYAWNHFQTFRNVIVTGMQGVVKSIAWLLDSTGKLLRVLAKVPGMGFLKGVAEDAEKAATSLRKVSTGMDDLRKPPKASAAPKIPGAAKPGTATGITGNASDDALGGGGGGAQTVQYITVYASNTNDIEKKLAMAAKVGVPVGSK